MGKKLTIEEIRKIAGKRECEFISPQYINSHTKHWWRCNKCGHEWEAMPINIKGNRTKTGTGCPRCAQMRLPDSQRLSLIEVKSYLKSKGYKLISTKYTNARKKILIRCKSGHITERTLSNISKYGCQKCYDLRRSKAQRLDIRIVEKTIKKRGGELLSGYINARTPIKIRCQEGHEWETVYDVIQRGSWCPKCKGRSERICRKWFESIFIKQKFPKTRPSWLLNKKTGRKLELDGYNEKLGLAFEFQGAQHFDDIFGAGEKYLKYIQKLDKLKRILCKEKGIILIEIPYFGNDREKMGEFIFNVCKKKDIIQRCKEKGVKIISNISYIDPNRFNVYETKYLEKIKITAKKKGGKCLSKIYLGNCEHLDFECSEGHKWKAMPCNIKKGTWCPRCARKKLTDKQRFDISITQKEAKKRGGEFLDKKYINARTKHKFRCKNGHIFYKTLDSIRNRNRFCKQCKKASK